MSFHVVAFLHRIYMLSSWILTLLSYIPNHCIVSKVTYTIVHYTIPTRLLFARHHSTDDQDLLGRQLLYDT